MVICLCTVIYSCHKDQDDLQLSNITDQPLLLPNLIQNPSFELNGQSSLQYWNYTFGACCIDTFSTDTAPGGGNFALRLEPMWVPAEGAVETYITGLTGTKPFSFRFYGKVLNFISSEASASVYKKVTIATNTIYSVNFYNPVWTQYILTTAPIQMQPTDTLVVKLSAGSTEVANWYALFDNLELYQIPY